MSMAMESGHRRTNAQGLGASKEKAIEVSAGGLETAAGVGAAVMAILGLVDIIPATFAALATIALGAGFIVQGAGLAGKVSELARMNADSEDQAVVRGELGIETLVGVAGVALGILALFDLDSMTLISAALIAFGGSLLIGGGVAEKVDYLLQGYEQRTASMLVDVGAGGETLIGIGAIALGVLTLVGVTSEYTLLLAGQVAVGAGMAIQASPLIARIFASPRTRR